MAVVSTVVVIVAVDIAVAIGRRIYHLREHIHRCWMAHSTSGDGAAAAPERRISELRMGMIADGIFMTWTRRAGRLGPWGSAVCSRRTSTGSLLLLGVWWEGEVAVHSTTVRPW